MTEIVQGGQVIARVASILRELSSAAGGVRTSELATTLHLTRPTTYRLLRALAAEGYVESDAASSTWVLGPELFVLGTIATARNDAAELAIPFVRRLAAMTGESAFLSARRGDETVCLLREEGSFPVRSFVLYEGVRFPVGVASAGLAILSFLPSAEFEAYLRRSPAIADSWGADHSDARIRERVALTRQRGFALNPGLIVEGSWGMGAAVFDSGDSPTYALSITGIEQRFAPERQGELGRALLHEAHQLSLRLAAGRPGRP